MERFKLLINNWLNNDSFERFLIIGVGIIIVFIISRVLKNKLNKDLSNNQNKYKARKIVNLFSYILFIAIILFVYNDKLGNIGTALGVAGAGIAFALQEVIVSLAGWVNIMTTNQVVIGQRVKIGDVKGDIIDIGVLSTTIMEIGDWINGDLYNGRIITLSNSYIFKETVHNYSSEYPFLWDELTIPIRTESDYHLARSIFTKVLSETCDSYATKSSESWQKLTNKFNVEDAQVSPMVTLSFDENWITFTLRYVVDYKKRRGTKDIIYTKILDEIAKHDNIIMIATSTLEISNPSNNTTD
jgi:hypothetical protein